jgi:hypothetical protein
MDEDETGPQEELVGAARGRVESAEKAGAKPDPYDVLVVRLWDRMQREPDDETIDTVAALDVKALEAADELASAVETAMARMLVTDRRTLTEALMRFYKARAGL